MDGGPSLPLFPLPSPLVSSSYQSMEFLAVPQTCRMVLLRVRENEKAVKIV